VEQSYQLQDDIYCILKAISPNSINLNMHTFSWPFFFHQSGYLIMPRFSSEPRFKSELLRTEPKFGSKFSLKPKLNLRSSSRFRQVVLCLNLVQPVQTELNLSRFGDKFALKLSQMWHFFNWNLAESKCQVYLMNIKGRAMTSTPVLESSGLNVLLECCWYVANEYISDLTSPVVWSDKKSCLWSLNMFLGQ